MKLKYIKHLFAITAVAVSAISFPSCKDELSDKLVQEAYIMPDAFSVLSAADKNRVYQAVLSEDGTTFSIRLPQNVDPKEELVGATAEFYLSMGATCEPPLSEPQDFSDPENPVVYTVTSGDGATTRSYTVDYIVVEPTTVEFGELFSTADICAKKTWVDLGWPGNYSYEPWNDNWYNFTPGQLPLNPNLGDIMGMPAFCGQDAVVVFARTYALNGQQPAFKVLDPQTLEPKGELNLGSIKASDVVAVASDWHGNMAAAVGRKSAGKSDIYVWTSPEEAPELIGSTHVSVEVEENNDNAASYINIAGDLTRNAVIAFGGPRDADGTHYKYKVLGGRLNSDYQTIKTGYSSEDQYKFQMISFYGINDSDPYLVGDCKISEKSDRMEDEVMVYLNGADGSQRAFADYYNPAYNGWNSDTGYGWWQRTGQTMKREGGRRPTVHAMYINGRYYAFWTTGSLNFVRSLLTDRNLSEYYTNYNCFWSFGKTTVDMVKVETMWVRDGYGSMADWYFDDETQHGYIALWVDRVGLIMFELSCVAML